MAFEILKKHSRHFNINDIIIPKINSQCKTDKTFH